MGGRPRLWLLLSTWDDSQQTGNTVRPLTNARALFKISILLGGRLFEVGPF